MHGVFGAMLERHLPPTWPTGYPPHRALNRRQANNLDDLATRRHGIPSLVLMEHASRGVAEIVFSLLGAGGSAVALCGPGNNGGDGYGAARFLRSWGLSVRVLRCASQAPPGGDAGLEFQWAEASGGVEDAWSRPQAVPEALDDLSETGGVVIDALFGVNLDGRRPLEEPFLGWIQAANAAEAVRLAVDVPSGLDAETGLACPESIQAHVTATMVAPKVGFAANPEACGQIVEVDIGLPEALHGPFRL